MLLFEPRSAERELESAVRGVVDGECLGSQHRGVTVGHPGDEQPEPDAGSHAGERGKRRHALERLARSFAVHRLEVVEPPGTVEPEVLGELHAAHDLVPWHPLLRDIETKTHRRSLWCRSDGWRHCAERVRLISVEQVGLDSTTIHS